MITRRNRHAFTTVELLVGTGLLAVLTLVLLQFFLPGLRLQATTQVQSELLRSGSLAMQRLVQDVRLCPETLLSYSSSLHCLAGAGKTNWTPDGTGVSPDSLWVWRWLPHEKRLQRTHLPAPSPLARLDEISLGRLAATGGVWTLMSGCVTRFHCEGQAAPGAFRGPFRLYLELELPGQHLQLTETVQPRLSR